MLTTEEKTILKLNSVLLKKEKNSNGQSNIFCDKKIQWIGTGSSQRLDLADLILQ